MTERSETFARVLKLEPGRTALLVVDMQRGFLLPGEAMEVEPARETVPRIRALVDLFRARRLPVVFTEFVYSEAAPLLVGELHPEHKPETIDGLRPLPGELVVRKRWYDGFAGTPLDGALRARGVTALVVTGTMTDICVLATVVGAFNREYRVLVVEDGVSTLWPPIQRAALDIVGRAYGRVVSSQEILDTVAAW